MLLFFLFHFVFIFHISYLNYNHIPHIAFTIVSLVSLSGTVILPCIFWIPCTVLTFLKSPGQLFCRVSYSGCLTVSETLSTLAEHRIDGGIVSGTCIAAEGWHHAVFSSKGTGSLWNSVLWEVTLRCWEYPLPDGCSILQWSLPYPLSHCWLQNGDFVNLLYPRLVHTRCAAFSCSRVSSSSQPHGLWPARALCLWDSPGKSTGMGCH